MTLTGYLSEYSLAEVFNFIHQGNRTGLLSISTDIPPIEPPANPHYLWFQNGQIMAVSTGMDGQGLLKAISRRKLVAEEQLEQLRTQLEKIHQPLGLHLKSRDLLTADQIKLLFNSQVIAIACKLFELVNGRFNFDPCILPYNAEMTGISMPAQEVGLLGLRVLRDWTNLKDKLPDPNYALQRLSLQLPSFRLDSHELMLWKFADGETPLDRLIAPMNLSIESLQQVGFRLITFGLVQEIPVEVLQPKIDREMVMPELLPIHQAKIDLDIAQSNPTTTLQVKNTVSTSFLGNLMGFLKRKG
jgi:Domain of unknown function (DUF4388)